jgi:tRNA pseudouridine38-40 synthase
VGRHDFAAFQAADCVAEHAVREVRRLELRAGPEEAADGAVEIAVVMEATAFVKHMVRNVVGTLVEVGLGRRDAASIPALLGSRDRTRAGRTAPAQGLCLEEVFY